ncbi:MAG: flippase [Prevotellaceae bacterium]|jgi:O-antigen/teichoic acid export membrane protein|nr:flippase [Prevotellaceae bacterium]
MSLKKNVVYNAILSVSNVAFPIVTTPYISRILGVENIGVVNFAVAYASYFALFVALGIPMYGMREIAKRNENPEDRSRMFSELFMINVLSALIFSLVYLVTIFSIPTLYNDRNFLLVAGALVLFVPLNVDWFFAGREKFKQITLRTLIAKVIVLAGLFIFVRTQDDIIPYLILVVAANLLSQIWSFGYLMKTEVKFRLRNLQIKKHINAILVLFASNIGVSIYTMLSTLMLGFLSDYTQVGYYTSAIKISKITLTIVAAMSPVMVVRINTIRGKKDGQKEISRLLNNSFGYTMMLAIPATVGLTVIAPHFVPMFFGKEFIPITFSVQLLSLLVIITGANTIFTSQILFGMGFDKKALISILLGSASSLVLNIPLIKYYGALGASIASVLSETTVLVAAIIFVSKLMPFHLNVKSISHPLLASLPIIPLSLWIDSFSSSFYYLLILIVTGVTVYIIIMVFILKNEQANQFFYNMMEKVLSLKRKNKQ